MQSALSGFVSQSIFNAQERMNKFYHGMFHYEMGENSCSDHLSNIIVVMKLHVCTCSCAGVYCVCWSRLSSDSSHLCYLYQIL